jgi:SAM-dependent methyltransferase
MTAMSVASIFTAALQGHACTVRETDRTPEPLPVDQWRGVADDADRALLADCVGPTLDVGCGPGRMAESLARTGQTVLGIDVLPEAVRQTLARGVPALLRSVFSALPGEGRWRTVLLADGNIGIGGDPVALLDRARQLLAPDGRVVLDVAAWGAGVVTRHVSLETRHGQSGEFAWTTVGADAIQAVATAAGLGETSCHRRGDRVWAVVEARS